MAKKTRRSVATPRDEKFAQRISNLVQPDNLKTDEYLKDCGGTGSDIWSMFYAAGTGDTDSLQKMLDRNPELVRCQSGYRKPLHFAVRENQINAVEILLRAGAEPWTSSGSKSHETTLQIAEDREYGDILELLQSHMERVHRSTGGGQELQAAVKERNLEVAASLLDHRPHLINETDAEGASALFTAVAENDFAMVDLLLDRGGVLDSRNARGEDLLYVASDVMIGYLLARGAVLNIRSACRIGDIDSVCRLLDANPELAKENVPFLSSPLRLATEGKHTSLVRLLLERGADPNASEHNGGSGCAVHAAAAHGYAEIAEMLLEHGADPNAYVESSGDSLFIAKFKKQEHMIPLLASYGASSSVYLCMFTEEIETVAAMFSVNPSLANDLGAFDQAIRSGQKGMVQLFLRYEPELIKKVSNWGKNAEFTRWLLQQGMPTNPTQHDLLGITQLHLMAAENHVERASLFLEFGADPYARDYEYGSTPLAWAARCGHEEMVRFLLEQDIKTNLPDDPSWATPLAWAKKRGHKEIARILRKSGART